MQAAPNSPDEAQRLATLHALDVLDTGPEEEFDALVRVASLVCGVPVSLVSLIDTERQFFKANIGLPGVSETPRDIAFCAHAILGDGLFEVPDASLDPRFSDNPLVTGHPDIRFYAGAPIAMGDGQRIGTLCVIDRNPRQLSDAQREVLKSLALAASKALEGRRAMRALSEVSKTLQETQDCVGLATKAAGVGIWNLDLTSGALTWDAQMYRLYGLEPSNAAGAYELWSQHVHAEDLPAAERRLQQCLDSGEDYASQFRIVRRDGNIRFIKALGRVRLDKDGTSVGVVGTNMDVTDVTLHEQELKAARDSAEAASLTKGQFLANMSHELRTPMNAVLGLLRVLSNTSLSANQFDYVSKIEGAAKSLLRLLNEILDFSKIEAGKLELDVQPFQLDKFLRELGVILSAYVGHKNIDILYDIDPRIPAVLNGDQHRLQQIVVNLAGNAVKFTESGEVVIGLKSRSGSGISSDGPVEIEFSVRDSGIGIAPEHQPRLFSSFSQAEASTTRRFGGTGLGLAISKRLIELMGGEITFTSELGKGTEFAFSLALESPASPATLPSTKTPKRVLLIDDNCLALDTIARTMRSFGWSVDVAQSGQIALELVTSKSVGGLFPYDFVYIDWQMPVVDGWQTAHQLTKLQQHMLGDVPRFIMTSSLGRESLDLKTQLEQKQISAFLVKPVTASMLFDASLPDAPDDLNLRRGTRKGKRELAGMRILVVEDNAINQQVAEELLSFEGALVSIVGDGLQGVNAVAAANPQYDAILMDVQMPVMDGYAATKAIRSELGLVELPIIGLTANAMQSDRAICLAAGMSEHVGKPFDLAQLTSILIRLTGLHPDNAENTARQDEGLTTKDAASVDGLLESEFLDVNSRDIDLAGALTRMGGMEKLYVRTARQLRADLSSFLPVLSDECSASEVKAVLMRLHTFKGATATVGLHRLSKALAVLESTCNAKGSADEVLKQIPVLTDTVAAADKALSLAIKALDPLISLDSAQITAMTWKKALLKLVPLLEAEDFSAIEVFAEIRGQLEGFDDMRLIQLETAMQNLELAEACEICRQVLALEARA